MKVCTLRLPEAMYESIKDEAAEHERSPTEYMRAILRERQQITQEGSAGDAPAAYDDLRDRVDELEERLDEIGERTSGVGRSANNGVDIGPSGDPSPGLEPWAQQKQTALELLRQRGEPVRKAEILDTVPDAEGIVDDTLWTEHVRPFIRDQGAELRGRQWVLNG